ncbi:MAG TPA: hypothetical protein VIV11_32080, partial [Kofleriaceae bacterium]
AAAPATAAAAVPVSPPDASPGPGSADPDPATARAATSADRAPTDEPRSAPPLTGKLAKVMRALARRKLDEAHAIAKTWHADEPGNVLALVALGEVLEARGDASTAARMYGSIIDLFPARADLRRFAGERLERLGARSRKLVIDTYRKSVADRPDHVSGHRLLAYALVRADDYAGAFAAILAGVDRKYPDGRFAGADRVLAEDAGMIAAAYLANGGNRAEVLHALAKRKLSLIQQPSTRFIMYWETDANDVDFHIRDRFGGHAFYQQKSLPSGGELYADVTTGYGPECFAIQGTPKAGPYRLSINYYSKGPMGYGMGLLEVQRFDGKRFTFDERPYVIMTDRSFVELGSFR